MSYKLTEKVTRLNDELQNYKSKETDLQRSLLIAEKNSEDTKSKAFREAKSIEIEAKNKAKTIVGDAEDKLVAIQDELELIKTQYAAYKSNFCMLMKKQLEFLKETDFDFGSYIDERALGVLFGATGVIPGGAASADFGTFDGLGWKIIVSLAGQLDAEYEIINDDEVGIVLTFPVN